jgi:hypothetical protein
MPKAIRQIRIEGNVAYVQLTKGHEAIIDAESVGLVNQFNWSALPTGVTVYAKAYVMQPCGKRKTVYMHRVVARAPDGKQVDHANGDGLDNRSANLRVCTHAENSKNRRHMIGTTSVFKGVYFSKRIKKWHAQIVSDGEKFHLGYHKCQTAAALAYVRASRALHGAFRRNI